MHTVAHNASTAPGATIDPVIDRGGGDGGDASGLPTIPGTSRVKTFKSWSAFVGGGQGSSGNGGAVHVTNQGQSLITEGLNSPGIYAQSVGGGGGRGGTGASGVGLTSLAIGGAGGAAGDGGKVTVDFTGGSISAGKPGQSASDPNTDLDGSFGIFAQSVGGGGGVAGRYGFSEFAAMSALYGSAGGNGLGGPVSVDYTGVLTTHGSGATGIFAQSGGGQGRAEHVSAPGGASARGHQNLWLASGQLRLTRLILVQWRAELRCGLSIKWRELDLLRPAFWAVARERRWHYRFFGRSVPASRPF